MSSRARDRLVEVLPEVYPSDRDARRSPLRDMLVAVERQLAALGADVQQSYEDAFVETGNGWALPYLGDLIRDAVSGATKDRDSVLDDLARRAVARFEDDVGSIPPTWWPRGLSAEAFAIRWKAGATRALGDERFREATYRALRGPWRAFRGARVTRETYDRALRRAKRLVPPLERVTIADFRAEEHLSPLLALFRSVESVKPTEAKWASTSKTLHFVLPDLVPPIDNAFTVPFLRRAGVGMRPGIDPDTLRGAFTALSALARLAGSSRLRELGRDPRYSTPIGMARVVDFAVASRMLRTAEGR